MVAELVSLDLLVWIRVSKSGLLVSTVGVSSCCRPGDIPLVSGPVVTEDPKGLMQRSLPALTTTRCAAYDLEVSAASCARRPAVAWPPVDDDCAWLPEVTEATVLGEAWKCRALSCSMNCIQTCERST